MQEKEIINVPNLKTLSPFIEKEKEVIVTKWIEMSSVKMLFKSFKIENDFFIKIFGIPILEYFLGVVNGTKKIGDCPVMNKFIAFLMESGVQARDIFILCMALRRSLISHLYEKGKITEKTDIFLNEISDVFDTNLSGVLEIFSTMSIEREKELQKRKNTAKSQKRLQMILNFLENMICVVKDDRVVTANQAFLKALSTPTLEELNKTYGDYSSIVKEVYINEKLLKNKEYDSLLEELTKHKDKTAKVHLYDKIADRTGTYLLKASKFPKSDSEYIVSFTDISEYDEKYENMKMMSALDPVTKAFNAQKFEQTICKDIISANKNSTSLFLLLLDIDNFGMIIDRHGETARKSILSKISDTINGIIDKDTFFARIRTGRFALIYKEYDLSQCREFAKKIKKELDKLNYNINDKITCSLAIVTHSDKESKHTMLSRANTLFEEAKNEGGSRIKDDARIYEMQKAQKENEVLILKELEDVLRNRKILKAVSMYKEIPISSDLLIVKMQKNRVSLKPKSDSFFMFVPKQFYITANCLSETILANVISSDAEEGLVVLSDFMYMSSSPLQRKNIRVIPGREIYITVKNSECVITASVKDLSLNSVNIASKSIDKLKTNDKVTTDFYIFKDGKEEQILVNGYIQNIKKIKSDYSIIVIFNLNAANDKKLSEYISAQQMQTIREYKNLAFSSYSI